MCKKFIFYGDVQGVGFRFSAFRFAKKLNLSGWIRNDKEGTVTLVCEGEEKNIKALIDYLKLMYKGNIEKIEEENQPLQNFKTFQIKRD